MKKVRVEEAVGLELCHDVTAMRDGFKGAAFKRGHIITADDVPELMRLGKRHVFIWENEAGEIHEEDAALRLSALVKVSGAKFTKPSEGKTVLISEVRGMFAVDTELLKAVNSINDITISTLPNHYPIEEGSRLASMRIVPLTTQEANIIKAERLCENRRLIDILPYKNMKAGIIITGSEIYHGLIRDKFEVVARGKLGKYPCEILGVTICDDDPEMLNEAITSYLDRKADIIIMSGGMSVDPDDLTPSAIYRTGADVISYGVPSQPGNMTMLAYLGQTALIGVPGAAISMPTTVFDVLLPQIFTGLKFTRDDLIRLGDGGLCQLCRECRFPNCTFGRY
ncbi:MAG: molybdopterin-binding protein [Synergistaceae bacterium]|nr:molybdopterin-binding protein [Synergistaceae bacterium]